jgi:hypothetical protein
MLELLVTGVYAAPFPVFRYPRARFCAKMNQSV